MKFIARSVALLAPAGAALAHPHAEVPASGLVHFLTQPDHFGPVLVFGLLVGAAVVVLRRRSARR